jgi:hypothetical protein
MKLALARRLDGSKRYNHGEDPTLLHRKLKTVDVIFKENTISLTLVVHQKKTG